MITANIKSEANDNFERVHCREGEGIMPNSEVNLWIDWKRTKYIIFEYVDSLDVLQQSFEIYWPSTKQPESSQMALFNHGWPKYIRLKPSTWHCWTTKWVDPPGVYPATHPQRGVTRPRCQFFYPCNNHQHDRLVTCTSGTVDCCPYGSGPEAFKCNKPFLEPHHLRDNYPGPGSAPYRTLLNPGAQGPDGGYHDQPDLDDEDECRKYDYSTPLGVRKFYNQE